MSQLIPPPAPSPPPFPVIAIDGPAGAGKSTVASTLARRLGFFLLDTGAIYRSLALLAQEQSISLDDGPRLAGLAAVLPLRFVRSGPGATSDDNLVFLGDRDVSLLIRTPAISTAASQVSAHPEVRAALLGVQRQLATTGPCVAEGRDIGTVVLPQAPIKLFMTASAEVRARRRFDELRRRDAAPAEDYEETLRSIRERDQRDETRAVAPTRQADDAIRFDTSNLALDQVIDQVESLCRTRLSLPARQVSQDTLGQ